MENMIAQTIRLPFIFFFIYQSYIGIYRPVCNYLKEENEKSLLNFMEFWTHCDDAIEAINSMISAAFIFSGFCLFICYVGLCFSV